MDNYQYSRLQAPRNIRLVYLLPGPAEDSAPLTVELVEETLDKAQGSYVALSYTCGDTSLAIRKPVICEGYCIPIYPTLYSALLKLRHTTTYRLLWCDGICIDQGNGAESLSERSQQVQIMHEIYSGAQMVVADLGDDLGEHQKEFVDVLHKLAIIPTKQFLAVVPYDYELYPDEVASEASMTSGDENIGSKADTSNDEPKESHLDIETLLTLVPASICETWFWSMYAALATRAYFGRLWVTQEHALAREVHFMLGTTLILGETVARGIARLQSITSGSFSQDNRTWDKLSLTPEIATLNPKNAMKMFESRWHRHSKVPRSVSWDEPASLLYETSTLSCTDKRDKLYGLLGLCRQEYRTDPSLSVDYRESLDQFTRRLSKYLVENGAYFVLYRSFGVSRTDTSTHESWMLNLDFTEVGDTLETFVTMNGRCAEDLFNQGDPGHNIAQISIETTLVGGRDLVTLKTAAVILPAISAVSSTLEMTQNGYRADLIGWLRGILDWCSEHLPGWGDRLPNNPTLALETLLLTIMLDLFNDGTYWTRPSKEPDPMLMNILNAVFRKWVDEIVDGEEDSADRQEDLSWTERGLQANILGLATGRSLARSVGERDGEIVLFMVSRNTLPGDVVSIIPGLYLPFVLRPSMIVSEEQSVPTYKIVGTAYVYDLMDSQILDRRLPTQQISII